jgi:hypothetical protein
MTENGLSQREAAAELSKNEVYISRHIAAYKLRKIAEEKGIDTSALETSVFDVIRTAKETDVPMLVQYIINGGGTMNAARAVMKDYRGNKPKAETPETPHDGPAERPENDFDSAMIPPDPITGSPRGKNPEKSPSEAAADITPDLPPPEREKKPAGTKAGTPSAPVERMPVEHRQVDVHDIFDEIYTYLTALETRIKELGPDAEQARIDEIKKEAALDIISLIHKRIDNA